MKRFLTCFPLLSICLSIILVSHAGAQFSQVQILIGTGYVGNPQEGGSVALSADGNTAIIGGVADNSVQGAAWIFTRSGGVWSQQGNKLVGTGATGAGWQGVAVALSSDGNTAIVGGMGDNSFAGAAWIFTRTAGVWSQEGSKLVGTGGVGAGEQGFAVALSADGNTAISGGYLDNSGEGAAWVFTRTSGVWSQQGSKLIGTGNTGGAYQGYSVAFSSDGNTAILGGYKDNTYSGASWIFTRSSGVWSQQGSKLVGVDNHGVAEQGFSVSLSADGNTALIGGIADSSAYGATWVFTRSGGVWSQQGSKLVGTGGTGANQGYSVSLSSDGATALIGGGNDVDKGAVWVFASSGGVWSQQGSKLVGANGYFNTKQGYSVSLSGDATTAIWGGGTDFSTTGAAWVFETPSAPLPVELTGLGAIVKASAVKLTWRTVTEVNSYGFEIERKSVGGQQSAISEWSKLGFILASGTSSTPHAYSFTDENQSPGRYSYRLKQIDNNGSFKYSQSAEVEVSSAPKAFTLSQNYPNPFNPSTTLEFTFEQNSIATVKIYNMLGQEVATVFDQEAEAGKVYQAQFNASRLTSGVYMSVLEAGGKRLFRKMLLVK